MHSPRRLLVILVVVCVTAGFVASAGSGAPHAPLQRVTMFGDSQLTGVTGSPEALARLGEGIDLDLRSAVCRRLVQESCPYGGTRPATVLDEARDTSRQLGSTVVMLV